MNVAVIRRPKESGDNVTKHRNSRERSLSRLQTIAETARKTGDEAIPDFYKHAFDVIHQVRESYAPARMPNSWYQCTNAWDLRCCKEKHCCGKMSNWRCCKTFCCGIIEPFVIGETWCCKKLHCQARPSLKTIAVFLAETVFVVFLASASMATNADAYFAALSTGWGPLYIPAVVMGYGIAVWFLRMYYMTMFKVTMTFNKSYALMKIPSDPLAFMFKAGGKMHSVEKSVQSEELPLLTQRLTSVNPRFLLAWAALREHIQDWEGGYFFELLEPIVSLEIVFVLAMLGMGIVFLLGDPYEGDVRYFLSDVVSSSNQALILLLFLILVVITLLNHLHALLRPYAVQIKHEAWLENIAMKMETEEANIAAMTARRSEPLRDPAEDGIDDAKMYTYWKNQAASLAKIRTVLEKMRSEMSGNRSAPKLLGVLVLNDNLIQSIIASISTALTGFVFAFVSGVMTDIQESSVYIPTTTGAPFMTTMME